MGQWKHLKNKEKKPPFIVSDDGGSVGRSTDPFNIEADDAEYIP